MIEKLITLPLAEKQLLAAIGGTPAGQKLSIAWLRDQLLNQADVLDALKRLVDAGKLDRATLRPVAGPDHGPVGGAGVGRVLRRGQSADGEPALPLFAELKAEAERRGLSLQKTSLSVFGSKAGIYSLRGNGTVRRKTADKIRAWIADAPSDDQLLPPVQAEPERPPPSVPPAPASEPSVVQVPSGVRKLRPYCRQPDTCVAPSRGPCRICHADAVNAGVKRRITHQAEALLAGDSDGKTSGGSVHPAVRAAANNIDATRKAQARQIEPVEQAKLALQRKGRTVYDASVCGGKKGHFHVSGKRDGNGRLLELTPAALLDEAERVTGQSFRRAPA